MSVFVLDRRGKPLMPCSEKRAKILLTKGRARIHKMYPFTIRIVDRFVETSELQNIEVKIDPGSKTTGICVSRTVEKTVNVLNLFELEHRGQLISRKLKARAALRRNRRTRNTRYRQPRFLNRKKKVGWLPPSLQHRVDTTMSWIKRFQRYLPVVSIAVERVKFDMQKMRDTTISGIQYQQGTLFQYEVTEYLLEKFNHQCAYCGASDCKLEKEHIVPKASGGTNTISNLTLACIPCNQKKAALPIEVFLKDKPDVLKRIKAQLKTPLKDAAAVNATRNKLFNELLQTGLPVAIGTGAQTKYNRIKLSVPKSHALDAACVGDIEAINGWNVPHIGIKCNGRGSYARTRLDKYGFPRQYFSPLKTAFGFQTGDMIKVLGRLHDNFKSVIGKIAIRQTGYFAVTIGKNIIQTKWNQCKLVQKADGYSYSRKEYSFLNTNRPDGKLITLGVL
jgi:5-methylcytosine-specific restriction endonuclease McrA